MVNFLKTNASNTKLNLNGFTSCVDAQENMKKGGANYDSDGFGLRKVQ